MAKVTVYSTPTCPYCVMVKKFLKDNNVEFEEIDVAADQEKAKLMVEKSGQMGVPVVEVDDEIVIGFDKEKLKELLKLEEE
ncbi:NrdH-redoxin [archaeon]|nr:NrdH-redoxin [archaeon]|tara:strand:+ start:85 stop:327 length:243 start_codon:yes stop_codon:yes gene_type:complete